MSEHDAQTEARRPRRVLAPGSHERSGVAMMAQKPSNDDTEAMRIHFPLLSDFEPKGEVSRRYGAYDSDNGFSKRALFVIDANGIIQWSHLSPLDVNPGAQGIFRALDELTAGGGERAEVGTKREVPPGPSRERPADQRL